MEVKPCLDTQIDQPVTHQIEDPPPAFPTGRSEVLEIPEASADPLLSGLSRPRSAALCLAARRGGRPPRRAGRAASAARKPRLPAEAGDGEGGVKMPFKLPMRVDYNSCDWQPTAGTAPGGG
jgi:hypothetical protein